MKERDYFRKREEIERTCRHQLTVLDEAWTLFNRTPPPSKATPKPRQTATSTAVDGTAASGGPDFNKRDYVRQALQLLDGEYGSQDARNALNLVDHEKSSEITDNQLSSIISRLASMGEIIVVRPKAGRRPAVYRNTE